MLTLYSLCVGVNPARGGAGGAGAGRGEVAGAAAGRARVNPQGEHAIYI